jgi:hypothetical protein
MSCLAAKSLLVGVYLYRVIAVRFIGVGGLTGTAPCI